MLGKTLLPLAALCAACACFAATPEISCVPLFESAGISVGYGDASPASCELSFRKTPSGQWLKAYPPVDAKEDRQFRGSLVKLDEDSGYEVKAELRDAQGASLGSASASFKTWTSNPPIGKTIELSGGPLKIKDVHGSSDAWIKYVPKPGTKIEGGDAEESAILVDNCSYLLFEGLKVEGGRKHGFHVLNSDRVRIANCEISGWSRKGVRVFDAPLGQHGHGMFYDSVEKRIINNDAAVFINQSSGVVVERCYAHDPRGAANSWRFSHPSGPNAVFVRAKGETVIRYNDFIGSDAHRWNDVIEGYGNGFKDGGFNKDADIYGNFLAFANDDGIELDGGQANVRFFGNKIEGTLCGVSTAPNMRGPSYVFENLVANLADEDGKAGSATKNGGGQKYSLGFSFFFNNSFYAKGRGIAGVGYGTDPDRSVFKAVSRNNALVCEEGGVRVRPNCPDNDFDFDLLSSRNPASAAKPSSEGAEAHGIFALPLFVSAKDGDFALQRNSRGAGEAVWLPNFGGDDPAAKRDMGAVQGSDGMTPPLRPVKASVSKSQLVLNCDLGKGAGESAELLLKPRQGAKVPLKFRIVKPEACGFFEVSPAEGTLSGKPLALKVSAVPAKAGKPGLLPGAFSIRFEDGLSLPVSVYVKASDGKEDQVVALGKFKGVESFKSVADKDALSGKALLLDGGDAEKPGERFIETSFVVEPDGPKMLYARAKAPEEPIGMHDSFFLSVDGSEPFKVDLRSSIDWKLSPLNALKEEQNPVLKPGRHELRIYPRESTLFDALVLKSAPLVDPLD